MSTYTCNTCELQFSSSQAQREHMKSDWHRYNLKRRVAHLSPITEELFNSKVQAVSNQNAEVQNSEGKKQMTKKEARRREKEALLEKKRTLLKLAEQNVLKNMKEQELELKADESSSAEDLTEEQLAEKLMQQKIDNRVEIPLTECFFCTKSRNFKTVEQNLDHMFKNHGFHIPEQKYLTDRDGLLEYICEKIGLGNVCIVCNFQGRTLEAVKAHMLAKRHCRIPYEEEDEKLEISQFYDFSSTYKQHQADTADLNDEDWEDVESGDEEASEDEDIPQDYIYHDGVELHLPTGIKVGHRSLQRYYRQNLRPEVELTEGQGTLVAAETRSFLTSFDRKQVQVQQRVWQTEVKDKKRHDKRAAKFINNQPHYRDQLLQ
ncbi:hypothetical protein HG537_0A07200 [Torulaspora globosa]|uniref:C2H2-type domain-containing protein n=1 Tax=Torulaspora globosa TaxID=48254 RepID=A0A7H9HMF5_9SACH|nr:hypothetical protein HG537_0A07200 [Torulaspora sp. CBS 2947]